MRPPMQPPGFLSFDGFHPQFVLPISERSSPSPFLIGACHHPPRNVIVQAHEVASHLTPNREHAPSHIVRSVKNMKPLSSSNHPQISVR